MVYLLFAIRYSLFAIRYSLFAIRYSLFAIHYSLFTNRSLSFLQRRNLQFDHLQQHRPDAFGPFGIAHPFA